MKTLLLILLLTFPAISEAATRWDVIVHYRCPGKIVTATYRHKSLTAARRTKATLDRWERAIRVYLRRVEV